MLGLKDGSPLDWKVCNSSQTVKLFGEVGAGRKKAFADYLQNSILHVLCSDGIGCLLLLLTNDHSGLSGLKQHKRVILYFWRSEVHNGSQGLKSRCLLGRVSF